MASRGFGLLSPPIGAPDPPTSGAVDEGVGGAGIWCTVLGPVPHSSAATAALAPPDSPLRAGLLTTSAGSIVASAGGALLGDGHEGSAGGGLSTEAAPTCMLASFLPGVGCGETMGGGEFYPSPWAGDLGPICSPVSVGGGFTPRKSARLARGQELCALERATCRKARLLGDFSPPISGTGRNCPGSALLDPRGVDVRILGAACEILLSSVEGCSLEDFRARAVSED